jgi:hypothetical protein
MSSADFDMERFDLKKINAAEVKEWYQVKISKRFEGLETVGDNIDINMAWKSKTEKSKVNPQRIYVIVS